jgi:hypothetical protein
VEARRPEHTPDRPGRQGGRYVAAPADVIQLLDLREIHAAWGYAEEKIYRAVADGRLRAYGRPGRQKYYSAAELIAAFGAPPRGGPLRPAKIDRTDNGRNQQRFEFAERQIAAAA